MFFKALGLKLPVFGSRVVTHACIAAGVGIAFSRVCLSVCPRSNRKTAYAIKTKLGTHVLHSSRSAYGIDSEVKRSKIKVTRYENRHGARLLVIIAAVPYPVLC